MFFLIRRFYKTVFRAGLPLVYSHLNSFNVRDFATYKCISRPCWAVIYKMLKSKFTYYVFSLRTFSDTLLDLTDIIFRTTFSVARRIKITISHINLIYSMNSPLSISVCLWQTTLRSQDLLDQRQTRRVHRSFTSHNGRNSHQHHSKCTYFDQYSFFSMFFSIILYVNTQIFGV